MTIKQGENGNIIIYERSGKIKHIIGNAYLHTHPRYPNEAILISSSSNAKDEQTGITIVAKEIIQVGETAFENRDATFLKFLLSNEINFTGSTQQKAEDTKPKTKEEDPLYVEFLLANTFEKMHSFIKKHQSNIGGKQYHQDGRLHLEEFLCKFDTFIIQVNLQYYYKTENQNLISEVLMWGSTENVFKPKKVYQYDSENNITGYVYTEVLKP